MRLDPHHIGDLILYVVFLLGQLIYVIKRAGFSMRAGRCKSRREYVFHNWDILLFRSALEFLIIYMPMRHWSVNQITSLFHLDLSWVTVMNLTEPISSPAAFFGIGIASDGLFDWLIDYLSRSPKVPAPIKTWLSENVQPAPLSPPPM